MALAGLAFIAGKRGSDAGAAFVAHNATNSAQIEPVYSSSCVEELNMAATAASQAFSTFSKSSALDRAALLCAIAAGLEVASEQLVARSMLETGLPPPQLQLQVAPTS